MPNKERESQLLLAAVAAGIKSPKELANFMAQVTVESKGATKLEEGFIYTDKNKDGDSMPGHGVKRLHSVVKSTRQYSDDVLEAARKDAVNGKPEQLAELMYGNRPELGNNQPGDGWKYHGRGYMQLTGKNMYAEAGQSLGLDLVNHPELAADPENATKIAIWYWKTHVKKEHRENVTSATHDVNGKENGLKERKASFEEWEKKLTPEVMVGLAKGEVNLPATPAHSHGGHKHGVLHKSSHGPAVKELQIQLQTLGYMDRLDTDGSPLRLGRFGPATHSALEAFQRDHHLKGDGRLSPETRRALDEALESHKQARPISLTDPAHSGHGLYTQTQTKLREFNAEQGVEMDSRYLNQLAASLAVQAHREGLTRIDKVDLGQNRDQIWALQNSLAVMPVSVDVVAGINTPIEKSTQQWNEISQQRQALEPAQHHHHHHQESALQR